MTLILQRIFSIEILGYSPNDVPGYTSLIISNIFLSGIQLFALGIIGEYISRIFIETKKKTSYLIREIIKKELIFIKCKILFNKNCEIAITTN